MGLEWSALPKQMLLFTTTTGSSVQFNICPLRPRCVGTEIFQVYDCVITTYMEIIFRCSSQLLSLSKRFIHFQWTCIKQTPCIKRTLPQGCPLKSDCSYHVRSPKKWHFSNSNVRACLKTRSSLRNKLNLKHKSHTIDKEHESIRGLLLTSNFDRL